ncbi:MAG: cupin domain-containing protein [Pseudomonadota bacterium]
MATHHAAPSEIVDLATWARDLPDEHSKAIVKSAEMELARLTYPAGGDFPLHSLSGPVVFHCLEGEISFESSTTKGILAPGQLVYFEPGEPHSIRAIKDSVVLLTIIFKA